MNFTASSQLAWPPSNCHLAHSQVQLSSQQPHAWLPAINKINENQRKSMKFIENQWKSMKINEIEWKSMKIYEIHWKPMKVNENLWNQMKLNE